MNKSYLTRGALLLFGTFALGTFEPSLAATGPCDIYKDGGTPCVAAHSTVRALFGAYSGVLYQVKRASDKTTKDIGVVTPGGQADGTAQDAFCKGTTCGITKVYDQTGKGNLLDYQGPGSPVGGTSNVLVPSNATAESFSLSGQKVYPLYIALGNSYWHDGSKTGIPLGAAPEGVYMVTSGTHYNSGCCYDYGNSETDRKADGAGAMDAVYFGSSCWFSGSTNPNYKCTSGSGPWVQGDLEYGIFAWNQSSTWNTKQVSFPNKYVTALLKNNGTTKFALKGGNVQGGALTTLWDGGLPQYYNPMKKQGAIILGSGGDCCNTNSNGSIGTFYEGAMVSGYPTDATDLAIHANISAAGYGSTTPMGVLDPSRAAPSSFRYDPLTSRATIHVGLERDGQVDMDVVDPRGRRVAVIAQGSMSAGGHDLTWDARRITAGVYFARLHLYGRTALTETFVVGG